MTFNEWKESLVEGKNPCFWCQKDNRDENGNNFHYYGEGEGGHCFSALCGKTLLSDEYKEEHGLNEIELEEYNWVATEFNECIHKQLKESTGLDGKGYRGIRTDISKGLGVRYDYNTEDGSVATSYYPVTKNCLEKDIKDSIVGYKRRSHPKTFLSPVGEADNSCDLFMQWKFKSHRGMLAICCGEVDAMSAYQMLYDAHVKSGNKEKYDEIAVVSGITGEGGMAAQLRNHYEWLTQFSKIIIIPDNDRAGKMAEEKIAAVLPRGKAFTVNLRLKDVNEYLVKGMEREFISDFWGNRAYTPDGIYASNDLLQDVIKQAYQKKISLPPFMYKVEEMLGKIVVGEIFTIYGDTSIGKSLFVDSIVESIIVNEPDQLVGVMSLEADRAKYATNLLSRHLRVNLNKMEGEERVEYLTRDEVKEKVNRFLKREGGLPSFYVHDNRGTDSQAMQESIYEMIKSLGVTVLVVDPISDVTSSMSREEQDRFTIWLKSLTLEFPYLTIIVVAHTRKRDINAQITEQDIIGSSILAKSSAQTISLERNKLEECPIKRNTTTVTVQKNRPHQITGVAQRLYFDISTGQMIDFDVWKEDNPHMFKEE